ncbi:hypothetical protein [Sulfitobacter sp.]
MHKRRTTSQKQFGREFACESHVFKECFVNFCGVVEEDAVDHVSSIALI